MIASKILVPTDYSEAGRTALKYATALARDAGATLLILHVQQLPTSEGEGMLYEGIHQPGQTAQSELPDELKMIRPTRPDVPYEHRLVYGDPAAEILQVAAREKVVLIVMTTHGRSGLSRLLMGSVAERVLRQAPCPVLTIKPNGLKK